MKQTLQQLNDASKAEGRKSFADALIVRALCASLADYGAVYKWLVRQVATMYAGDRRELIMELHRLSCKGIYGVAYTGTADTIFEQLLKMWLK